MNCFLCRFGAFFTENRPGTELRAPTGQETVWAAQLVRRCRNEKFNGRAGIQTADGSARSLVTGLIRESILQCLD
jgi:hypothetical protein